MEQQKVFPTAMFGFDKKVVLDYIYEQDHAAKEREEKLQSEADALQKKIDELQGMVEELTSQQEIVKAQLYNEKEAATSHKAAYEKLRSDADQLIQVARNKDNELQIQLELNKQLQNRSADQENQMKLLLHRVEELEQEKQMAGPVEEAVAKAAKEADTILENARNQAQEIMADACLLYTSRCV